MIKMDPSTTELSFANYIAQNPDYQNENFLIWDCPRCQNRLCNLQSTYISHSYLSKFESYIITCSNCKTWFEVRISTNELVIPLYNVLHPNLDHLAKQGDIDESDH